MNKKNIITYIALFAMFLFCVMFYVSNRTLIDDKNVIVTDREYWRGVASNPQQACRLRGGEYRVTLYKIDFASGNEVTDYKCEGMKSQGKRSDGSLINWEVTAE